MSKILRTIQRLAAGSTVDMHHRSDGASGGAGEIPGVVLMLDGTDTPAQGQQASASSLPAVIANDQTPIPLGAKRVSVTIDPTLSVAGTYTAGDYLGQSTTPQSFTAARINNGSGVIEKVVFRSKKLNGVPFALHLLNASFTAPTDNAAWNLSATDTFKHVGHIDINAYRSSSVADLATALPEFPFVCVGGVATLWYALQPLTDITVALVAGDIELALVIRQD